MNYITNIIILNKYGHIKKDLQWKSFILEIMIGVGGIFPNNEDHLLDEKKISEHFGGYFHEILHYPLNFTWQYNSPQEHFIDFKYFDMEWKDKL